MVSWQTPEAAIGQIRIGSMLLRVKGNVPRCPSFF